MATITAALRLGCTLARNAVVELLARDLLAERDSETADACERAMRAERDRDAATAAVSYAETALEIAHERIADIEKERDDLRARVTEPEATGEPVAWAVNYKPKAVS